MAKIIYIAGYGRSGSTVLASLLGNHPHITCIGEVHSILSIWEERDTKCSCGEPLIQCPYWGDLFRSQPPTNQVRHLVQVIEGYRGIIRTSVGVLSNTKRQAYAEYQNSIFNYVVQSSGVSIIVDASKSGSLAVSRFLALARFTDHDVRVIHLTRSGTAVVATQALKGSNVRLETNQTQPRFLALRTSVGWTMSNLLVLLLTRFISSEQRIRIRYEDLVTDPIGVIDRLAQFADFDPSHLIDRVQTKIPIEIGHVIGGNRIRFQGAFTIQRDQSLGEYRLARWHRLGFGIIGGWLQLMLGYRCPKSNGSTS